RQALVIRSIDELLEVRQSGCNSGLQQHLRVTVSMPNHHGRAMLRPLEGRSFVAAGFHQTLLVRFFAGKRANRQQFASRKRDFSEIDRLIFQIAPLAQVLAGVSYLDYFKVIAAGLIDLVFLLILITAPAPSTIGLLLRFGR